MVLVSLIFSSLILHHLLFVCLFRILVAGTLDWGVFSARPSDVKPGELSGLLGLTDIEEKGVDLASELDLGDASDEADVVDTEVVGSGGSSEGADSLASTNLTVDPITGVDGILGVGGTDAEGERVGVEKGGGWTIWRLKHS